MNGRRAASLLGAFLAASVVTAAPAQAEQPRRVLVGATETGPFGHQLPSPLFTDLEVMVPLDGVSETFYIKNDSPYGAHATVQVNRRGPASEFSTALDVAVDVGDGDSMSGSGDEGSEDPTCTEFSRAALRPGEVMPIRVDLALPDLPDTVGVGQSADIDLVVTLTEQVDEDPGQACGEQATDGPGNEGSGTPGQGAATNSGGGPAGPGCATNAVVVTAIGTPVCPPTQVAAGSTVTAGGLPLGESVRSSLAPLVLGGLGALLAFLWRRHRPRHETALGRP